MQTHAKSVTIVAFLTIFGVMTPTLLANTVVLGPIKDNTLFDIAGSNVSNGAGDSVFVGRTGALSGDLHIMRGVMKFDVAGSIPVGATIQSASLELHCVQGSPGSPDNDVDMQRLTADWGEGTSASTGGTGAPATPGDATWLNTFFPGSLWASAGGDFSAIVSASTTTTWFPSTDYTWSSAQLVADVQDMLDNPAGNHGWILIGDEANTSTARRFRSREAINADNRPELTIVYTVACSADTNMSGNVDVTDLINVILDWDSDGSVNGGDTNRDGIVNVVDLLAVILQWGSC